MPVKFKITDQSKISHFINLLDLLVIRKKPSRLVFDALGIFICSESPCKSLLVNAFFEEALLDEYEVSDGPHVYGVSIPSLIACLRDGGKIEIDGEYLAVTSEHEGFCQTTRIRLSHILPDSPQDDLPIKTVITINADLMHGIFSDFQHSLPSETPVKITGDTGGLTIEGIDVSSGLALRASIPKISMKIEGDADFQVSFKLWLIQSVDKLFSKIGTSLAIIELTNTSLTISHKPIGNTGVSFTLQATNNST